MLLQYILHCVVINYGYSVILSKKIFLLRNSAPIAYPRRRRCKFACE